MLNAGKKAYLQCGYYDANGHYFVQSAGSWASGVDSYTFEGYTYSDSTGSISNLYLIDYVRSKHAVQLSRDNGVGWHYYDDDNESFWFYAIGSPF